jgi:hypothetical protein
MTSRKTYLDPIYFTYASITVIARGTSLEAMAFPSPNRKGSDGGKSRTFNLEFVHFDSFSK